MTPIKTILVPTDFGDPARSALSYAIDLARTLRAKIVLCHAFELPIVGFPDGAMVVPADVASRIVNAAQKALDELAAEAARPDVELTTRLKEGDPRDVILEVAAEAGADLVVMGTHGRRGIARALIGSVTERIVRTSSVPVVTVHAAAERPRA